MKLLSLFSRENKANTIIDILHSEVDSHKQKSAVDRYIKYLIDNGMGMMTYDIGKAFAGILYISKVNKKKALDCFDELALYLINITPEKAYVVYFLCGCLSANDIVDKETSDNMSAHYLEIINQAQFSKIQPEG